MFTHTGITGPAVFALSAHLAFENFSSSTSFQIRCIPDSHFRFDDWENMLSTAFRENGGKEWKNVLSMFFPRRFAEILPRLLGIPAEKKASLISREERRSISRLLSDGIILNLTGRTA